MTVRCASCHTGLADRLDGAARCPVCYGPIHKPADPAAVGDGGEATEMRIPAGNASTSEWRAFTRAQNAPFDVELRSRDELRDWFRSTHGGSDVDHNGDALVVGDRINDTDADSDDSDADGDGDGGEKAGEGDG